MSSRAITAAALAICLAVVVAVSLAVSVSGSSQPPAQLGDPIDVICPAAPGASDAARVMRIPARAGRYPGHCPGAGRLANASKAMTTDANKEES